VNGNLRNDTERDSSLREELEHRSEPEPVPPESVEQEREARDLSLAVLGVSLVLLAVVVAAAMGGMGLILGALETREEGRQPESSPLAVEPTPPQPRLETLPGELRRRREAAQQQVLESYAWLDRQQGIVRIPVERAMEVLAERGLPVREDEADPAGQQSDSARGTMDGGDTGRDEGSGPP